MSIHNDIKDLLQAGHRDIAILKLADILDARGDLEDDTGGDGLAERLRAGARNIQGRSEDPTATLLLRAARALEDWSSGSAFEDEEDHFSFVVTVWRREGHPLSHELGSDLGVIRRTLIQTAEEHGIVISVGGRRQPR